jgi:hypothetical protein
MYVDTRTTADEVKATLVENLRAMTFGVLNACTTRREHPSYTTAKMLRTKLLQLEGAVELAGHALEGHDNIPQRCNSSSMRPTHESSTPSTRLKPSEQSRPASPPFGGSGGPPTKRLAQ